MPPRRPMAEPTDISMLPVTMTSSIPSARMPVTAVWRNRMERFRGDSEVPFVRSARIPQITTRAIIMVYDRIFCFILPSARPRP